ncbi:MAG: hypothetical protein N2038_07010 [Geminicoccaceae bacterium]|nr:hypothetical protein [Geminicoccaceae bacterium]MCX7629984.1 hypothetical protein [Geminicoccaceae bacterium]
MRRSAATAFVLLAISGFGSAAATEPVRLDERTLDRITAASGTSATEVQPQVWVPPPRDPREFLRWLRWRLICSRPGVVCIMG